MASFDKRFGGVIDLNEKARWFESAAQQSTNSSAKEFFAKTAKETRDAEAEAAIQRAGGSEAQALMEQRLFEALRAFRGSSLFSMDQIKDLPKFVNKLKSQSDRVSAFLWQKLARPEQAALTNDQPSASSSNQVKDVVVQFLNRIIQGPSIYEQKRFKGVRFYESSRLLKQPSPTGLNLAHFNRYLLEDAYQQELLGIPYSDDIAIHGSAAVSDTLDSIVQSFGQDHAAAARRLVELVPKVRSQLPELDPYFLSAVVTFQLDTNAPVVAELEQKLVQLNERPDQVLAPEQFWNHLRAVCGWSFEHRLYGLAAQVMEGEVRAAAEGYSFLVDYPQQDSEDKIVLAFAYKGMERWQQAPGTFLFPFPTSPFT